MGQITLKNHQCQFVDAVEQYVGLFGGVGNGKTYVGCLKIIELATQYPNNLCLVGRLTYPELRDSTREVFLGVLSLCYPQEAYKLNIAENYVDFWNGSRVIFRHLDNAQNLLSMNLGAFYVDQAEEVDEETFKILQGRLRRPNCKLKGLITGNPKGFNWVYYMFGVDQSGGSSNYKHPNGLMRMISAPTIANQDNLPPNYMEQMRSTYSDEWYQRYVLGSWDVFEGQIWDVSKIQGYDSLPQIKMVVSGVDPAISKSDTACNSAICTLGVGVDGFIYDLETIAGKWSFLETLEQIKGVAGRQRPRFMAVESTAYQMALVEAARSALGGHSDCVVEDAKADRDKYRRAKSVSHIVDKGLFRSNDRELIAEMTAFNGLEKKDNGRKDRVDALVHAFHMVQKYAPVKIVEEKRKIYKSTFDWMWEKDLEKFKSQEKNEEIIGQSSVNYDKSQYY